MQTLIKNGFIITFDSKNRMIQRGDILIKGNRIERLGERIDIDPALPTYEIDAENNLILPGMVNSGLSPFSILRRGYSYMSDQESHNHFSFESILDPNSLADLTYWLSIFSGLEMLQCGVTTVVHRWEPNGSHSSQMKEAAIKAYQNLGIRIVMVDYLPESSSNFVVYNPLSDLLIGKPLLPLYKYQSLGVPLVLGTGAFAANHNMFDVLKAAFSMQRILQPDYNLWPTVEQILKMATTDGARYCGLESKIGSLEEGKNADLVLYDVRNFSFSPLNNPLDQFVCLEDSSSLLLSMVNGTIVFNKGHAIQVNEAEIKLKVNSLYTLIQNSKNNVTKNMEAV